MFPPYTDALFDWAEVQYQEWFPTEEISLSNSEYMFRYYDETQIYLGVRFIDDQVYWLGPHTDGLIEHLGSVDDFLDASGVTTLIDIHPFEFSPIDLSSVEYILPLGGMIGGHVTPIDHQYYVSSDFTGNQTTQIDIQAPASGVVTQMEYFPDHQDYRIVVEHPGDLSSIFIHVDSLSDRLIAEISEGQRYVSTHIDVSAGERLGFYTGSVDYSLHDESILLTGFLNPSLYTAEPWKVHTVDPFDYFVSDIKDQMIDKSLRSQAPWGGKIDYDQLGRLSGNWFALGSQGYAGGEGDYWSTHLSFAYDYIDDDSVVISIGDYLGEARQFNVTGNGPDPVDISPASGLVKYELSDGVYLTETGNFWNVANYAPGIERQVSVQKHGTVLVQLMDERTLRFELFVDMQPDDVEQFSEQARVYYR